MMNDEGMEEGAAGRRVEGGGRRQEVEMEDTRSSDTLELEELGGFEFGD